MAWRPTIREPILKRVRDMLTGCSVAIVLTACSSSAGTAPPPTTTPGTCPSLYSAAPTAQTSAASAVGFWWAGRRYIESGEAAGRPTEVVLTIRCELSPLAGGPLVNTQPTPDATSVGIPAGTKIYRLPTSTGDCQLAAELDGQWKLFAPGDGC